jgi:hypothetical protein
MMPCATCGDRFKPQWWHKKEANYTCCECRRKASRRKTELKYPDRVKARRRVLKALKDGILIRGPCIVCGDPKSQGHHDDYRRPLDVKWLCQKHHLALHADKRSA